MLKHKYKVLHNNKLLRLTWLIICFGFLFVIVGCSNNVKETQVSIDFQDRSWLIGVPCSPPCWYGLVPDQAIEEDIIAVLHSLNFVDVDTIDVRSSQFFDMYTNEYFPANQIEINLKVRNGERGHIRFLVTKEGLKVIEETLNYEISIGEIIEFVGIPDYVISTEQPAISGESFCSIEIFWVNKQLSVEYQERNQENWLRTCEAISMGDPLEAEQRISQISILNTNFIKQLETSETALPWPGLNAED